MNAITQYKTYDEHQLAVYQEYEPSGKVEALLVDQLSLVTWQLKEIIEYELALKAQREEERENVEQRILKALDDWWTKESRMIQPRFKSVLLGNREDVFESLENSQEMLEGLAKLSTLVRNGESDISGDAFFWVMMQLADMAGCETEVDDGDFYVMPGESKRYDMNDDALFEGWTTTRMKRVMAHIANRSGYSIDDLINRAHSEEMQRLVDYTKAQMMINEKKHEIQSRHLRLKMPFDGDYADSRLRKMWLLEDIEKTEAKIKQRQQARVERDLQSRPVITISSPFALLGNN